MAKRKKVQYNGRGLFDEQETVHRRRLRPQRALFIPRLLREKATNRLLEGDAQDKAHEIAVQWANLETSGHLPEYKERAIDAQFLDQIFGKALGYRVKTESPEAWEVEHQFFVPGVGPADAALGKFPDALKIPTAMVELKGAKTDLDRDKSNGRTAVQQCWDYINAVPGCDWGIVSNFKTIRLYHRERGTQTYQEFTLQGLRDRNKFNEFYYLFERGGLLQSRTGQQPRALDLLRKTVERQKEVGDELYKAYQWCRLELIQHLHLKVKKPLDSAIGIAQKLLDRIIFIAFCEDRELLPEKSLENTQKEIRLYSRAKNPEWESFLDFFKAIDEGAKGKREITAFNGGLFKDDPEINALELVEDKWVNAFVGFGKFDFSEEVNVEVLGHLFERSITELEKLRVGGLFALQANIEPPNGNGLAKAAHRKGKKGKAGVPPSGGSDDSPLSKMPKSAQRKRFGIYYTPPAFTGLIVERTIDALVKERFATLAKQHKVDPEARENQDEKKLLAYWNDCLVALRAVTVCDPACGSGAFLIRAYEAIDDLYTVVVDGLAGAGMSAEDIAKLEERIPEDILSRNLYGVDLSHEAVEITQLALWIRSARKGKTLADLSKNIIQGNSLVSDTAVDPKALVWESRFPQIFGEGSPGGFSCVIGNPPWERVKLQSREFFSLSAPNVASGQSAAEIERLIANLIEERPEVHSAWLEAQACADRLLNYARKSGNYPLTGKADVNLYMLFVERAQSLVASDGLVGLLVPSGIATDDTTKEFFGDVMNTNRLASLYDFENRNKVFEDVDGRFKFSAIVFGGETRKSESADFVFFAHGVEDTAETNKQRHIPLTSSDMALLNPNTRTCPIFRTRRDSELTKDVYKRVPILIDDNRKKGGNPWGIKFLRMFDQASDSGLFRSPKDLKADAARLSGNRYRKAKSTWLPLYEAKMLQAYDHRAASVFVQTENWSRTGQKFETTPVQHANPEFLPLPRWWVEASEVPSRLGSFSPPALLAYKDITSTTNERTMIATFTPVVGLVHSAPIVLADAKLDPRHVCCLLANFNSFPYDFIARQKVGGNHLSYFIVEQLPTLLPDTYTEKCRWAKKETLEHWISERVLKLSCTAEDMIPLAQACDFKGSRGDGVHIWKEEERAQLRAELDAAYFHLYGISRDDAEYILSTFTNTGVVPADERPTQQQMWSPGSPGERILEAYDRMVS